MPIISPGDSLHLAKTLPIMTADAPAAIATATSPGFFIPPSEMIDKSLPSSLTASAQLAVANKVGAPARVITLVEQIEPLPIPTLNPMTPSNLEITSDAAAYVPTFPTIKGISNILE